MQLPRNLFPAYAFNSIQFKPVFGLKQGGLPLSTSHIALNGDKLELTRQGQKSKTTRFQGAYADDMQTTGGNTPKKLAKSTQWDQSNAPDRPLLHGTIKTSPGTSGHSYYLNRYQKAVYIIGLLHNTKAYPQGAENFEKWQKRLVSTAQSQPMPPEQVDYIASLNDDEAANLYADSELRNMIESA